MKKSSIIFILTLVRAAGSHIWAEEKPKVVSQQEMAVLLGEKLNYKDEPIAYLKKIGVTPLGEWMPEKPLTKDDFDAILIRIARRSPVVENTEPGKILDAMGFTPRDISPEGIKKVLDSEAFKRATINSKLILCMYLLPLPPTYQAYAIIVKEIEEIRDMSMSTFSAATVSVTPAGGDTGGGDTPPPGDTSDTPPGDTSDTPPGDTPPPDIH